MTKLNNLGKIKYSHNFTLFQHDFKKIKKTLYTSLNK